MKIEFFFPAVFVCLLGIATADESRREALAAHPIKTDRVEPVIHPNLSLPTQPAVVGQSYKLTVSATNKGAQKIMVPLNQKSVRNEWIWDGVGIRHSANAAVQRFSIFTNPPSVDYLNPGETKTFRLTWTPTKDNIGTGSLFIILPPEFKPLIPVEVTVKPE